MSVIKKIIAGVLVISLVGAAGAGALMKLKESRVTEVLVVSVDSLASDYYSQDTVLEGNVTTNISQNIRVDSDMIVDEIYVDEGQPVSIGTPLVSFDMTLVEMELNIAKLKQQLLEREYDSAEKRLTSLKNGGPITTDEDEDYGDSDDSFSSFEGWNISGADADGFYLASIVSPVYLAFADDFAGDDFTGDDFAGDDYTDIETPDPGNSEPESSAGENGGEENQENPSTDPASGENTGDDFADPEEILPGETDPEETDPEETDPGEANPDEPEDPIAGETEIGEEDPEETPSQDDFIGDDELADEYDMNPPKVVNKDFLESDIIFYDRLEATTIPFMGKGTEKNPFVFLCSSENESVIATGAFLNVMAGLSPDGTKVLHKGGYWYQLEFHEGDELPNTEDRKESCTGYFLIDGGVLESAVDPELEYEYYKSDAMTYDPPFEDWGGGYDGGTESYISREEAISSQERRVSSLSIQLQEGELNIEKLERKVKNKVVYSRIDGVVSSVGGSLGNDSGNSLVTVKSKDGFYVKGSVSELMLDELTVGTVIDCMSYQTGNFEATILEVADYPLASGSSGWYGSESNPNVSYYSFSASISDQTMDFMDGDWLQITLRNDSSSESGKLVLSKAFVRSENGKSYVYKDVNGVLKKQYVTVGGNVDYGYSVLIKSGITRDDRIAFPYGKAVVDGAKTKEGTTEQLYGY